MGDKDNMMFDNCSLFYCNKPIETGMPIATLDFDLSSEQSDDEKVKWDNQCGHTITYDVKVKKLTNKEKRIFYGKYWKLPRKLKKWRNVNILCVTQNGFLAIFSIMSIF